MSPDGKEGDAGRTEHTMSSAVSLLLTCSRRRRGRSALKSAIRNITTFSATRQLGLGPMTAGM